MKGSIKISHTDSNGCHTIARIRPVSGFLELVSDFLGQQVDSRFPIYRFHLQISPSNSQISPSYLHISPSHLQISSSYLQISSSHLQISSSYLQISPSHLQISSSYLQISPSHLQISSSYLQISPFQISLNWLSHDRNNSADAIGCY